MNESIKNESVFLLTCSFIASTLPNFEHGRCLLCDFVRVFFLDLSYLVWSDVQFRGEFLPILAQQIRDIRHSNRRPVNCIWPRCFRKKNHTFQHFQNLDAKKYARYKLTQTSVPQKTVILRQLHQIQLRISTWRYFVWQKYVQGANRSLGWFALGDLWLAHEHYSAHHVHRVRIPYSRREGNSVLLKRSERQLQLLTTLQNWHKISSELHILGFSLEYLKCKRVFERRKISFFQELR